MMRKILFIPLLFLFITSSYADIDTAWVARYDGIAHGLDYGRAVAADGDGNVYVTGRTCVSGSYDEFGTIKYDAVNGKEIWVKRYDGPGTGDDYGNDLCLDPSANICVTGVSTGSGTSYDYATIKYEPDGGILWSKRYNGTGSSTDWPTAIGADASGNVYVTGYSYGTSGDAEYATIKYKSDDGTQLWAKRYTDPAEEDYYARDIFIDNSGNCYVTGETRTSGIYRDYVTVKYSTDGSELWARNYDGPAHDSDQGTAITVDNSGNVFVTGNSRNASGNYDYATVKYDPDGNQIWDKTYDEDDQNDNGKDITVDGLGNIYVTGESNKTATSYDYATIKYDTDGNRLWVRRYDGGSDYDYGSAIFVDNSNNVYVTGRSRLAASGYDYATIKYDTDGNQEWVVRYDGPGSQGENAQDIFVDDQENVYVTGYSKNASGNDDYATIKYSPPQTAVELVNFGAIGREGFVDIRWMTEVEVNNYKWLISRAQEKDGVYKRIAEINAKGNGPNSYSYNDSLVVPNRKYWYKLGDIEKGGTITWHGPVIAKPIEGKKSPLSLLSPFPNPGNGRVKIKYWIPSYMSCSSVKVTLKIYNLAGQCVKTVVNKSQKQGYYTAYWNGKDNNGKPVTSGLYFCRLTANNKLTSKLLIRIK
jgi:uncharacterized delta-60 repeat protein